VDPAANPAAGPAEEAVRRGWWDGDGPEGWTVVEDDPLQLQSRAGRLAAERLAAHLAALQPEYGRMLPGRVGKAPLVVKVFENFESVAQHDPEGTGGGYFDPEWREIVIWHTGRLLDDRDRPAPLRLRGESADALPPEALAPVKALLKAVSDDRQLDTAGMAAHEGWHAALQEIYGVQPLPAWLEEGVGDWFGAARPAPGGGWFRRPPSAARVQLCRAALEEGTAPGLAVLLSVDRDAFYADSIAETPVYYSWAELFVRWLLDHPEPEPRALIPRLLKRLEKQSDVARATRAVLDDDEVEAMEREFHDWVAALEPVDPVVTLAETWGHALPARALSGPVGWILAYDQLLEDRR
jgi:hypothetical protein